jgi:hypothetical protein
MSVRYLSKAGPSGNRIVGSRVFILLMFLIFIFSVPAFGQQMGQLTAYTDSWADDDGTIYSSGVTADSSNSYSHTYGTRTTLTSPSGRTSSAGFYSDNSYNAYAYAEASLPWDWNDLGDFSEQSQHSYYCPISGRTISFNTSTSRKAGVSHAGYYLTGFSYCRAGMISIRTATYDVALRTYQLCNLRLARLGWNVLKLGLNTRGCILFALRMLSY